MKKIYLVKQTTIWEFNGEKDTVVLNAWTSKEAAKKFVDEMIELDNQMNLKEIVYSYQITPIRLLD